MALQLGIQTNDNEVCIPSLSSILLAVAAPHPSIFTDFPTVWGSIIIAVRHIPKMVIPTHLFYSQMFTMHDYFLAPRQLAR